jgi:2,4-dienoyl-CoA reductase-like NADH-dependent reductase (Old Yellow Enzyme family)
MCQYSAVDGVVGDWHLVHLGSFATGGAGLVFAEATAISAEGRISVNCPGLWNDEQVVAWRRVTDFAHSQSTPMGIQLAHAGRKGSTHAPWADHPFATREEGGWQTVAPSALAFEGYPEPRALTLREIDGIVEDFVSAAHRALAAGFDVLEVHAAHGYLLHEFLSPLSNHREDDYGGSFENRTRLVRRVVEALRRAIPETTPLFVRLSATDWTEGGWSVDDTVALSQILADSGVDLVDVSSGGNVARATIPVAPGYQVAFAERVRREAHVPASAVGLITEARQADEIIRDGRADAVMLARASLRNPRWTLAAAETLGRVIAWAPQFERARTLHS